LHTSQQVKTLIEKTTQYENKKASAREAFLEKMVGRDGFEPSTNWLKANCSTD
jgi:hypothetical protein